MKDRDWTNLVESVRTGSCVLVLGPDVPAVPKDADPSAPQKNISVREAFCGKLIKFLEEESKNKIEERSMFALAQMYEDSPLGNLKYVAAKIFRRVRYDPGQLHLELADCPFRLILTTCHDDLFEKSLLSLKKTPSKYLYHYRGDRRDNIEGDWRSSSPKSPILYHLYGAFDKPESLVLTENDLLEFITGIISNRPGLPDGLTNFLENKTFLFVGFGIRHWYVRVLLKLLMRAMGISRGAFFAQESIGEFDTGESQQTVLFYKRGIPRIEVVEMDGLQFARELAERLRNEGGYLGASTQAIKRARVFISYERSDTEMAQRLFQALPEDRIDPFLDSELEGGQLWDQELQDRIHSYDYFVVLNSLALAAKEFGYVNKELSMALNSQMYRQYGKTFILPLLLEGVTADEAAPALKKFDQMPLRIATFKDDVSQLVKTITRDFQRRPRMR
jgi:hypothetical protein